MAALAARIAARRSILGDGWAASELRMESRAEGFVEGRDADVGEDANPDWGVAGECAAGGTGADGDEEDDGGTITVGRCVVCWDGCGCDSREKLIGVRWGVLAARAGSAGGGCWGGAGVVCGTGE
jgi:hypothetical protein